MLEVAGERPQQGEANLILEVVRERHVRVVPEGVRPKHRERWEPTNTGSHNSGSMDMGSIRNTNKPDMRNRANQN